MGEWMVREKASSCAACCINVARWIPVFFVLLILAWAYYAYVYELCIVLVENTVAKVLYIAIFHVLLALFVASYYQTIFAPVGKPPQQFYLPPENVAELSATRDEGEIMDIVSRFVSRYRIPVYTKAYEGGVRYCPKCKCIKPDRAHHCSICSQCVLKFDHHCPWVNTCVSFYNYKFFLLFLAYGFTLCLFGSATNLPYFIEFWANNVHTGRVVVGQFHIVFLFFVSTMFALSLFFLFFYHLLLTARNRTTLESFRAPIMSHGPDKRAYDLGVRRNYREIFGDNAWLWLMPVYSSLGDGAQFESRVATSSSTMSSCSAAHSASSRLQTDSEMA